METNNEAPNFNIDMASLLSSASPLSENPEIESTVMSLFDRAFNAVNGIHT